jgi:murein DD-endopeptidase MepM/ murein hydrolase activator NlpD
VGHTIQFFYARRERSWFGLGGVPLQTPPGAYELRVTERLADGHTREILRKVQVAKASYPSATIRVAKQFTEPSQTQLAAIAADKSVKQKTFSAFSDERLWSGSFTPPVSAPVSAVFGTGRVFNHEVQSRHEGLDYAVPAGTPVRAIGRGAVLLARPMFFEGNFVVVDHGQGLLSLYLHLSEFKVKEGETVSEGQVIGLSGGTGRATGAHLHLAVRWQGVYLNPAILLRLAIPAN